MTPPAKLIAFYLPQYHPIPENDRWWGQGFTEWTNVSRARPLFPGHHQPQLPADLGFYDLRLPEARAAQAALAREYGIHGFCYYHYWFNGKHLLERPFSEVLASGQPDFPFCLCWANENWTRRWDGAEQEILIGQNYGDDDDRQHIQWLIAAFRDPRYIRVGDKPLILIYRARHLPNPKRTLDIWRREARQAGIGELFICRVENFANERDDPHALGFDASVDFQPDWMALPGDHPQVELPDSHVVVDYRLLVEAQLARPDPPHKRFYGVTPAWDNSARRKKRAFITADSSPAAYGDWLEQVLRRTLDRPPEERIVFINAWNEWAEGNHLEPDQKFGRAYLEATRDALAAAGRAPDLIAPPLRLPLELDSFVTLNYYQDWLQARKVSRGEAPHFDQLFASQPAPHLTILLDATGNDDADADANTLAATLQSVAAQQYPYWRLRVFAHRPPPAGLNSPNVDWLSVTADAWPDCILPELAEHRNDWYLVLRTGERLASHALLMIAADIATTPSRLLVATDGDEIDTQGQALRALPMPGLQRRRLWSHPDWPGLAASRGGLLLAAAGDAQATDLDLLRPALLLRTLESAESTAVHHCPIIALHRPASRLAPPPEASARLVAAHLARLGLAAGVLPGLTLSSQRVVFDYPADQPPTVAILLGHSDETDTLRQCVETLLAHTTGLPFVLRIALPDDAAPAYREFVVGLAGLALPNVQVVECPAARPAALANALAEDAAADLLVFFDPHCLPLAADWLETLARLASQTGVGAVGARLVDSQGAIHTAFLRLGLGGAVASAYVGLSANIDGVAGELQIEQNAAAVAGRCLAVRKEVFTACGQFRAEAYPDRHADVDLCQRLRQHGLEIVWTPHATLLCTAPAEVIDNEAPPSDADRQLLADWLPAIAADPFFNRQLSRHHATPTLEADLALSWQALPWRPLPKIYAHPADTTGCGEIRIRAPMKHLRQRGRAEIGGGYRLLHVGEMATLAPDSVILQRPFTDVGLRYLRLLKAHLQTCLIYELDDLITRIPKENASGAGFPADIAARVAAGMGLCDRLLVSTAPLAEAYRRHCAEVRVMPNYLDGEVWDKLAPTRREGGRPRVGWAGSASHGGDLALIEECVKKTAAEVDWIFLGLCPPELARHAKEIYPSVPVAEYPAALAGLDLDLAVAPLAANAFNEAKSNLKLLEYGALGYPVICSNILPYQGSLAVTRVGNRPQDWLAAIRAQVHDLEAARRQGALLRQQVMQDWLLENHLDEWLRAWRP